MYKKGSYKKVLNSDVARISRTTKYRIQSRRGHYTTKNNVSMFYNQNLSYYFNIFNHINQSEKSNALL